MIEIKIDLSLYIPQPYAGYNMPFNMWLQTKGPPGEFTDTLPNKLLIQP